jgi:O-antigen ligase/tetratricopeptide (TPR) repeat protein
MRTGTISELVATRDKDASSEGLSPLKLLAQLAIVVPVVALAWWFGGVQAVHQKWLFAGLFVALVLLLCRLLLQRKSGTTPLPVAIVPLGLAMLLGLVQLAPIPGSLMGRIAPNNLSLWQSLLPSAVGESSTELDFAHELGVSPIPSQPVLSLYPNSTRHDLGLLVAAVAAFFLASRLFSTPQGLVGLLAVISMNGAALAFFGLAQQLRWNGLLFGSVPLTEGGAPFASFVNRNSGAGFLNICLGAAIGLTIWTFARTTAGETGDPNGDSSTSDTGRPLRIGQLIAELTVAKLAMLSVTIVIFAGVVCSLSRGAWISATAASAVAVITFAVCHRAWIRASLWIAVAVLGLAIVAWAGRMDVVEQRFASLWDHGNRPDSRLAHWENGLATARNFAFLGSGLGTYRYVYRLHEQNASQSWFYHAENQYLEAFVEAGLVGLSLMLGTICLVAVACWRLVQRPTNTVAFAAGLGGLFALASQGVHAGFDFGLYMPANMAVLAMICGAICGAAARSNKSRRLRRQEQPPVPSTRRTSNAWCALPRLRSLPVCVASLLVVSVAWGGLETRKSEQAESALRASRLEYRPDVIRISELDALLARLIHVSAVQPDNAETLERLGQLWILRYRLQALPELRKLQSLSEEVLWGLTSTVNLHRRAHELLRDDPHGDLAGLRRARDVRLNLKNAGRCLIAARRASPLMVRPHLLLAEIAIVVSDVCDDESSLTRAITLVQGDHDLLLECGLLAAQAGRNDQACDVWRRAIEVLPEEYEKALSLASQYATIQERVTELIPDSPDLIIQIARERFADEADREDRHALASRASRLLDEAFDTAPDQRSYLQGAALALGNRPEAAIPHYERAVQTRPDRTAWRYELAQLLVETGQLVEAERQATLCANMQPANERYAEFQQILVRRRVEGREAASSAKSSFHEPFSPKSPIPQSN